ncbi:MAG: lipoyl protein ligase domain-containing protein [Planctomycetota bacterium]|jgi:lipoate-protein ligase B
MHLAAQSICSLGRIAYDEGVRVQREYAERRRHGETGDTLLLCEHPPVYTLGTNADPADVREPRAPVVRSDRGGETTWHGPGQVVGYVICDLSARGRDLHRFCRDLEEIMLGGEDRGPGRARAALGDDPRLRTQRELRPFVLRRHRAVRDL